MHTTEPKRRNKAKAISPSYGVSRELLALLACRRDLAVEVAQARAMYEECTEKREGAEASARVCDALGSDALDNEIAIVEFPVRTLGDVIAIARLGFEIMTAVPQDVLIDDYVKYLIGAVLRLDREADQDAIDALLDSEEED